jgi:hypothetical protein
LQQVSYAQLGWLLRRGDFGGVVVSKPFFLTIVLRFYESNGAAQGVLPALLLFYCFFALHRRTAA